MKRIMSVLITVILILSFSGCDKSKPKVENDFVLYESKETIEEATEKVLDVADKGLRAMEEQNIDDIIRYTNYGKYLKYFFLNDFKGMNEEEILNSLFENNSISESNSDYRFVSVEQITDNELKEYISVVKKANIDISIEEFYVLEMDYGVLTPDNARDVMYVVKENDNYYLDFYYSAVYDFMSALEDMSN